jgi:predicted transcriptional regulator
MSDKSKVQKLILEKLAGVGSEFAEDWAVMETLLGKYAANVRYRLDQTNQIVTRAVKAVADRDQAELGK